MLKTAKAFTNGGASFDRLMNWLYQGKRMVPARQDYPAHTKLYYAPWLQLCFIGGFRGIIPI